MQPTSVISVPSAAQASLGRYLLALRRRWKTLLLIGLAGMIASALLAFLWPPTYRSNAVILIEQQEVPQDLVRSTITSYADQRVQTISQRVMTTSNLLEIVHRYNLYPDIQKSEPREALIQRLRKDIGMSMISADVIDPRSGRPTQATIAFSVSYDSRSPDLALKVANEITTLYLNENLTSRTRLAKDTASFLGTEAGRLNDEIALLESKLADFKERNVDNLPELAQLNFQLRDRTELELRDAEARMRALDEQTVYLQAQLAQLNPNSQLFSSTGERILSKEDRLKTLRTQLASLAAVYAGTHPDVARVKREIAGLEGKATADASNDIARRLEDARNELAAARKQYSADHPDVKRLERSVAGLETALADATAVNNAAADADAAATKDGALPSGNTFDSVPNAQADNPAYIQIRAQLQAAKHELNSLETRRQQLQGKLTTYAQQLALSPQIEREYRELMRDFENAQRKYQEVRAKQMEAELAQNLESDRKGERFTMIEPPLPPERPVSPNRLAILLVGLLLSLGAGLGVVMLRDTLDTTVRSRQDLITVVTVPPLAVIPLIATPQQQRRRRMRIRAAALSGVGAMVVGAVAIHFLYRPLDVLWFVVMRRLGI